LLNCIEPDSQELFISKQELSRDIDIVMKGLRDRERRAIEILFFEGRTVTDGADEFGVSLTRFSQIIEKSIRKMRTGKNRKILECHLGDKDRYGDRYYDVFGVW
jgi:RNA polymerase sigma factor (sigma-70 family)